MTTAARQTELAARTQVLDQAASVYHAADAVSRSRLEDFLKSERRYEALYITKTMRRKPPSDPLKIGTALHAWYLEPEAFEQTIAVAPAEVLSKRGAKEGGEYRAWEAQQNGRVILKPEQWDLVKSLRRALFASSVVRDLFANALAREESIYWTDERTGLPRKARFDLRTTYNGRIVVPDLKTTCNVMPDDFSADVGSYRYYRQAAYYSDAHEAAFGEPCHFVFIALSTEEPHRARVYHLRPRAVELGHEQVRAGLDRLMACYDLNSWAESGESEIELIDVPRWVYREEEE